MDNCNNNLNFSQVVDETGIWIWMDLVYCNSYKTSCSVIRGYLVENYQSR